MPDSYRSKHLRLWRAHKDQKHLDDFLRAEKRSWQGQTDSIWFDLQIKPPYGGYNAIDERLKVLNNFALVTTLWTGRVTAIEREGYEHPDYTGSKQEMGLYIWTQAQVRVVEGLFECSLQKEESGWRPVVLGKIPEYLQDHVSDATVRLEGAWFFSIITGKKFRNS